MLQISTVGCNFNCPGCISTIIARDIDCFDQAMRNYSPGDITAMANAHNCLGIAFLMNDPLASLPTFLRVAKTAKKSGLLVGCSSNCYFTESSLADLIPHIDFIHIGFKGVSNSAYTGCGSKSVEPVLRNTRTLMESGIHVEASCIHQAGGKR